MATFTKLKIDRIEEGIVIAFSDDGEEYHFSQRLANVHENDVCDAVINSDSKVVSLAINNRETQCNKDRVRNKLNKLFTK